MRRGLLDDIAKLNEIKLRDFGDPEIATRISQYEMAYKMQASVPELTDFSQRAAATSSTMYGPEVKRAGDVRLQLPDGPPAGRARRAVRPAHARRLGPAQQPHDRALHPVPRHRPALRRRWCKDLKQRGLLDDTLVIWGGEFGRTPFLQGNINDRKQWGRDHHPYAFTVWMAGGGVKPGLTYGATDDLAMNVVENPVHVHDFQATLLHLLGIDHERLTFQFQGRDFRLTDVHGKVVKDVIA